MSEMTIIRKSSDTEYITVAECLRRNGYRHYLNGMKYLEQGLTHHARGSFAKAQRNYWRSEVLGNDNHYLNDALAQKVAATVMYMDNGELILRTISEQEMYKDG